MSQVNTGGSRLSRPPSQQSNLHQLSVGAGEHHQQHSATHSRVQSKESSPVSTPAIQRKYAACADNSSYATGADSEFKHMDLNSPKYLSWRRLYVGRSKLRACSETSSLLAGFGLVAMVEAQIDDDTEMPEALILVFALCTTLLVAVHLFADMVSTCILPHIESIKSLSVFSLVDESPHDKMYWFIEMAWGFSTVLGLLLFLVELVLIIWIKFFDFNIQAAWAATIIVIPTIALFILFALHFHRTLTNHKYETSSLGIQQLEELRTQLALAQSNSTLNSQMPTSQSEQSLHFHTGGSNQTLTNHGVNQYNPKLFTNAGALTPGPIARGVVHAGLSGPMMGSGFIPRCTSTGNLPSSRMDTSSIHPRLIPV